MMVRAARCLPCGPDGSRTLTPSVCNGEQDRPAPTSRDDRLRPWQGNVPCHRSVPFPSFAEVSLMEQRPRFRPQLEALEDRWLPNNFLSPGSGVGASLFEGEHMAPANEALFLAALTATQNSSHGNEGNPGVA